LSVFIQCFLISLFLNVHYYNEKENRKHYLPCVLAASVIYSVIPN